MMKLAMALVGPFLCCGCSLGLEWPPGPPGADGKDGNDGPPGLGVYVGAPAPISGSRLEIRYRHFIQAGDDGSLYVAPTLVTSLWDTMLGEYCAFVPAEDGVIRCLPNATTGKAAFQDAGCAEDVRLINVPPCGDSLPSVEYFVQTSDVLCPGPALYEKGPEVTPEGTYWYTLQGSICVASSYTTDEYRGFRLGAHVPPTTFQSGQPRQLVEYSLP